MPDRKPLTFSIKRKSGTIRDSCHGVKTKRGKRVYVDCPSVGSVCLLDDIHQLIIAQSMVFEIGKGFMYKIESYDGEWLNENA